MNSDARGLRLTPALLGAALLAVACSQGAARAQIANPPLPPPRPQSLRIPQATPATSVAPPTQQNAMPSSEEAPLDPDNPPMLPQASRQRMSECGREWQAMKKAGKEVDLGWREFATRCLTR